MLAAAFLFNLGQGVLRPSLPLYLRDVLGANYRMVTLIPVAFGAGKWVASLPTGYLLDRIGRLRMMVTGLGIIAACDIASLSVFPYSVFLGVRGSAGAGWAMFATVATTAMVQRGGVRGRSISLLLMSETFGLLIGSAAGGWFYQGAGRESPFIVEAGCMVIAAAVLGWFGLPAGESRIKPEVISVARRALGEIFRVPGVILVCVVNGVVMGIHSGVLVFLFPLYLVERGLLPPEGVGYIVALGVVGRLLALWLGGGVSDRSDRMSVLALGLLGFGIVLGTLSIVIGPWLLGVWSVLIGAGGGLLAGLPTAIIGDRVDPALHGIAVGWLRTVTDTGMLLGPLVMGPLADARGLEAPFLLAAVMMCGLAWACRRAAVKTPVPPPADPS